MSAGLERGSRHGRRLVHWGHGALLLLAAVAALSMVIRPRRRRII